MSKPCNALPICFFLALSLLLWSTLAWAETIEYEGLITPYLVVDLGTPTQGIVAKVKVDRSSPVKQGQTLIELEASVERAELEKAEALTRFNGEIGLQQTQLEFAKRVSNRFKQLGSISVHDKDQAATEIALTGYRLEKARENRSLAKLELKKARAVVAQRSIKSPISGVVVDRFVSPGEFVNNQPLLRLAQIDPLRIEVIVPAQMFGKIKPGMTATIVPELPEYATKKANVSIVDKVVDSASSTFAVRLELPNPEHTIPSGIRCQVQFNIDNNVAAAK